MTCVSFFVAVVGGRGVATALVAVGALHASPYAPADTFSGGIYSYNDGSPQATEIDMQTAANTTAFRANGGRLYIHPNSWWQNDAAGKTQRQKVANVFTTEPIYETTFASDPGSYNYASSVKSRTAAFWSHIDTVNVNKAQTATPRLALRGVGHPQRDPVTNGDLPAE